MLSRSTASTSPTRPESSIRLILGRDDEVAAWVGSRTGIIFSPPYVAIGWTDDDKTYCGGAVFNNFNHANIDMSMALDRRLTRGVSRALHEYVFGHLKCTRCTCLTPRRKKKVRKLLARFGFKYEGIRSHWFGPTKGDDAFSFVLFPDTESKFYGLKS